jgi:hypothetical protein
MSSYRRFLLDMHIPDWDEAFLSAYDPRAMAALWAASGIGSVMLYCLSHTGLAYWPTKVSTVHGALTGRDLVGESLASCREEGLEAFAYYSAVFNNQAWHEHPEWRIVPSAPPAAGSFMGKRYGHVCPNNEGYQRFVLAQVDELMEGYGFDGFFFDMTFWPAICLCPSCRQRFRDESGLEIPETVDWYSGAWCAFQSAREHWMTEFALLLSGRVKEHRPGLPVYHNAAVLLANWTRGIDFDHAGASDFLGGDFYGDGLEQQMISRFMTGLSRTRPVEFMTSRTLHLKDHVQSKSRARIETQAYAAMGFGAAIRFIDAIDPAGTVNPAVYNELGTIYRSLAPLEPYLGGEPIEDIAVYVSDRSRMNFSENGRSIHDPGLRSGSMPHVTAALGAVRALQRAHLPFGVITRKALDRLGSYKVVVLPDVLRMDEAEIEAIRAYVEAGGCLYASRRSSLTLSGGRRLDTFALADVFGCDAAPDGTGDRTSLAGTIAYIKPGDADLLDAVRPQTLLSHDLNADEAPGMVVLRGAVRGEVLGTLCLPYGWPEAGSVEDRAWASIHSSPPWTDTGRPVVVGHATGGAAAGGRAIYSAADIESVDHWAHERFFLSLIGRLLGEKPSYGTDAPPSVWMNVFHQAGNHRCTISFLNHPADEPAIPIHGLSFWLRLPPGCVPLELTAVPSMERVRFSIAEGNCVEATPGIMHTFQLLVLDYSPGVDPRTGNGS